MTVNFEYVLDDELFITHHPEVQKGFSGIFPIFTEKSLAYMEQSEGQQPYRPITLSSYAIENALFNNNSGSAHFINILIFIAIGFALFHLFILWFPQIHIRIWFTGILLFIAHPIHTEVIANVKSRDELLTLLFGIVSLIYFWKYHQTHHKKHLFGSLLLFLLACLSKENGITWLGVFPLSLYFFKKDSFLISLKKSVSVLIPAFVFLGLWGTINQGSISVVDLDPINNILFQSLTLSETLATKFSLIGHYFKVLLFPITLSWDYSFNQIPVVGFDSIFAILSGVLILGLLFLAFKGFKKRKLYAFWILFFILLFSVSSNLFIEIGATMAERFIFIPSLAFCFLLPWGLVSLLRISPTTLQGNGKNIFIGSISVLLLLYSIKTITRNSVWENNLTLSESGIISAPNSSRTHLNFAIHSKNAAYAERNVRRQRNHFENAEFSFKRSIEIYPNNIDARYNLGVFYFETGRSDLAYQTYMELIKRVPKHVNSLNNIGNILFNANKYEDALVYLNQVLAIKPDHPDALINVGAIAHNTGDLTKAVTYYEKSLTHNPSNTTALKNIIIAYNQLGESEKIVKYQTVLDQISKK